MGDNSGASEFENVACPFCGLVCDDLQLSRGGSSLKITKNGCGLAEAGFERQLPDARAQISGRDVDLGEAIKSAADLIKGSKIPLYGGLATDVHGMRAVMSVADRSGGVVDHALSEGLGRNISVLQSAGWFMSTLTETRNRADMIVVVGSDVHRLHPRFFERIVNASESMFATPAQPRTIVFIGDGLDQSGVTGSRVGEVITLPCALEKTDEVLSALRARVRDFPVSGDSVAGIALKDIDSLVERFRGAAYGVMVWAPAGLMMPRQDLAIHTLCEMVKDLNKTTRWAGLSLGGNEGATSATSVCGWQSGYPLRVSFARGAPQYDPHRYSIEKQLADGEVDLLVWVASYSPQLGPPETSIPTIVVGTPGLELKRTPEVFIPVGTPGVDHGGRLIRCDNVVSLPLRSLHRSQYLSVADIFKQFEAAL